MLSNRQNGILDFSREKKNEIWCARGVHKRGVAIFFSCFGRSIYICSGMYIFRGFRDIAGEGGQKMCSILLLLSCARAALKPYLGPTTYSTPVYAPIYSTYYTHTVHLHSISGLLTPQKKKQGTYIRNHFMYCCIRGHLWSCFVPCTHTWAPKKS